MVTITHTMEMSAEAAQSLVGMANFYRMTVEELLGSAMMMGLAQAEHVMMENMAHAARIEAAMKAIEATPETTAH